MEVLSPQKISVESMIREVLPIYTSNGSVATLASISKQALFASIPRSSAECEESWCRLACFESTQPSGCFIPSSQVQLRIWENLISLANATRNDLTKGLDKESYASLLDELQVDYPPELAVATMLSVSKASDDGTISFDADRFVRSVGESKLNVVSQGNGIRVDTFIAAWSDLVPEQWRGSCRLDMLSGAFVRTGDGEISSVNPLSHAAGAGATSSDNSKVSLGAKRKWHEKFRASKKA